MTPAPISTKPATLEDITRAATLSVPAATSQRAYAGAIGRFINWYTPERGALSRAVVLAYRDELAGKLAPKTVNASLAAVRAFCREACAAGWLDRGELHWIEQVGQIPDRGTREGRWLDREQAAGLLRLADRRTLTGKRDAVLLGLLVGCALRRSEAAALAVEDIRQVEGRWAIVDIRGKGGRIRTVPMPGWVRILIEEWGIAEGPVLRAIGKGGRIGESMTPAGIWWVVRRYAERAGYHLAPHDLRRTFAKLARSGGAPLEQVQLTLGHESLVTTQRYLGSGVDFQDAACDRLGINPL